MSAAATTEISAAKERIEQLRQEVARTYIGSSRALEWILAALLAKGHVLLEGVPGVAKTTLVKAFRRGGRLQRRARIQFTPDLLPADVTGTYVHLRPAGGGPSPSKPGAGLRQPGARRRDQPRARQGAERAPRGDAGAAGHHRRRPHVSRCRRRSSCMATQNPIEHEGTYPLPEAQIDRFLVRVPIGYPTPREEAQMLKTFGVEAPKVRAVFGAAELVTLQELAARIHVEEDLFDYAVGLTTYTRTHARVALGASPRATLALVSAAKAWALMQGRPFLVPDDVRAMAPAVLAHRLVLTAEAEGDPKARDQIVEEALNRVGYRRGVRAV